MLAIFANPLPLICNRCCANFMSTMLC